MRGPGPTFAPPVLPLPPYQTKGAIRSCSQICLCWSRNRPFGSRACIGSYLRCHSSTGSLKRKRLLKGDNDGERERQSAREKELRKGTTYVFAAEAAENDVPGNGTTYSFGGMPPKLKKTTGREGKRLHDIQKLRRAVPFCGIKTARHTKLLQRLCPISDFEELACAISVCVTSPPYGRLSGARRGRRSMHFAGWPLRAHSARPVPGRTSPFGAPWQK